MRLTVCGLFAALSATVSVPVRCPVVVGVNVTAIEQLAPAATELPHALVCAKSPETVMPVTASAVVPALPSVTVCGALVVCTVWLLNARLVVESVADADDEGGFEFAGGGVELLPPQAMSDARPAAVQA